MSAFIKPKLLEPEFYGLWNLLSLTTTYSTYNDFGARASMKFTIPYYDAKSNFNKSSAIKGAVYYGALYINLFLATIILLCALIIEMEFMVRLGLITISLLMLIHWHNDFYNSFLKLKQQFNIITKLNFIESPLSVFLSIVLIYHLNIYGVFLSALLSGIFVILYFRSRYPLGKISSFSFSVFIDMVKIGFPITIFNFSIVLVKTFNRAIVSFLLGNKQLGYYGIAITVFDFFMQIPGASREVIEPRLMQNLDKMSREETLKEFLFIPLVNTAYLTPLLIGPVFFVFPVLLPLILPKYIPGIVPTQIIILGAYFFALSNLTRGILVANDLQRKSLIILAYTLAINIGLSYTLVKYGAGLNGVALGTSISYFFLFISLIALIRRRLDYAQGEWKTVLISICWPFPVMCSTIILLKHFSKNIFDNAFIVSFFNLAIYSLVMLIFLNHVSKLNPFLKGYTLTRTKE